MDGLTKTFLASNGDVLTTLKSNELIQFQREQKAVEAIAI
jgi:NDP-sugar pyrophosphorylase family protein